MRINRVRFSSAVQFFAEGFMKRWNLNQFLPLEPAVFVGCYSRYDIDTVLGHDFPKIVMLLGADMPNIRHIKHDKSIIFASDKRHNINIFKNEGVKFIDAVIPLKDFSLFTPEPKGDKIYCYINQNNKAHINKYTAGMLNEIIQYFGNSKFIWGTLGLSQAEVVENYYKPSFVNLQLNPFAGFTTAIEMACMGRMSVSNSEAPFSIPFKTPDEIINTIINQESEAIKENIIGNYLYNSDDWLEI